MKNLKGIVKSLRKNMTKAERKLWNVIRGKKLGVKFRRQVPIENYIVDFVCFEKKIIIEVDGGQHMENKYDIKRDEFLKKQGYRVLRFWNNEILSDIESVVEVILSEINSSKS